MTALARRHDWVADLAASFPALLFALAFPRAGVDARAALVLATTGAPLARIAAAAEVPLWLRAFPPHAFAAPIPALPDTPDFRRRIANHFPKDWRAAPRWLDNVALGLEAGDAEIALWFAREAPLRASKKKRYRLRGGSSARRCALGLVLWAQRRLRARFHHHTLARGNAVEGGARRGQDVVQYHDAGALSERHRRRRSLARRRRSRRLQLRRPAHL
ncbi:MAG: hypothetical protein R3C16_03575 [Hyphomonadaceae bacterium]